MTARRKIRQGIEYVFEQATVNILLLFVLKREAKELPMNKVPAVFFFQSSISNLGSIGALDKLTFSEAKSTQQIADWEQKMRDEVGLKADLSGVTGICTVSGSGGVGGGSDDCDQNH